MTASHDDLIELLTKADIVEGVDLSALEFDVLEGEQDYVFQKCTVKNTRIKGAALRSSQWNDCQFENCMLTGTNLREAVFEKCQFFDAGTASGGVFRYCELEGARFKSCDLSLSSLIGCTAFEVEFTKCKMPGFKIEKTDFSREFGNLKRNQATFEDCNMIDAQLHEIDFSTCIFKRCELNDTDLSYSNLTGAEVTECNLYAVDFKECDLSGVDLRRSDLDGIELMTLANYQGLQISAGQQHLLLNSIGIDVFPDDE